MSSDRPINGYKTIYLNTHSPSTAAEADADALPTYRIYEENTDTPILTGTMAKLDDANTLGQYVARIALTTGNGFEEGKEYGARMRAVVETIPMNKTEVFGIAVTPVQSSGPAYVEGPHSMTPASGGVDGIIERYGGDALNIAVILTSNNRRVNLTGKTLTPRLRDSAGANAGSIAITAQYLDGGQLLITGTAPTARGVYQITIGVSGSWSYGPLLLEVP